MKLPPLKGRQKLKRGEAGIGRQRAAQIVPRAKLAGPVPWVLAIMIALIVVACAGALSLGNLADRANAELSGALTVQVIEASASERRAQTERAAELLGQDTAVEELRVVPEEELDALLEPWLGTGDAGDAVPIPALIDVQLTGPASDEEIARLQTLIADAAPAARIDAQSSWLQPVYSALSALQYLAFALIILLALTATAAVWLATRSALENNRDTVEIVHLLGGTDSQIARIFQRSVGIDASIGGAAGLGLGLIAVIILASQFSALDSGMIGGGVLGWLDWLAIALIPVAGVGVAVLTARLTIGNALRQML
ncbi:cell division protein FtsX [Altererythrobacter lutimaris]|uniref:Cell division protein n=1 Tax=Altererythrobacter lutimaris TaxID=2743979 RepID=A0A850HEK1_9SPHN|nr:FtsX-like permease family protein [Altererythrobacter lutimaris]NVE95601.1 cell division protein [Altererythrobacter lutimaris]